MTPVLSRRLRLIHPLVPPAPFICSSASASTASAPTHFKQLTWLHRRE